MASVKLGIKVKGGDFVAQALKDYGDKAEDAIYFVLLENAKLIAQKARSRAPVGKTGNLKRSIRAGKARRADGPLAVRVYTSGVPYAPYQEFGTGRGARGYVPTLPTEIQRIALSFKRPPTPKNPNITPKKFLWNSVVDQTSIIIQSVEKKLKLLEL